jgi:CBS domain-containing protein
MTRDPIVALPDLLAYEAPGLMEDRPSQISVLPVVDAEKRCIGLLRLHDSFGRTIDRGKLISYFRRGLEVS